MNKEYIKYKVIIDGSVAKWSGNVYALCQEDAFDVACDIAIGLGGDFIDVLMCYSEEGDE